MPVWWLPGDSGFETNAATVNGTIGGQDVSIRLTDIISGAGLFTTNSDPNQSGVDPLTDADAPLGTDVGFGAAIRRALQTGVYNGDFLVGPADATAELDNDENPLPYWSVVHDDGGHVDVTWASGAVTFTVTSDMEAAQSCYLEQLVPVPATTSTSFACAVSCWLGTATPRPDYVVTACYLASDAVTAVGSEQTFTLDSATVVAVPGRDYTLSMGGIPATARYLRVRAGVSGGVAADVATVGEVRLDIGSDVLVVADRGGLAPGIIMENAGALYISPMYGTAGVSTFPPSYHGLVLDSGGEVSTSGDGAGIVVTHVTDSATPTQGPTLDFRKTNTNVGGAWTAVSSNQPLLTETFYAYDGGTWNPGASMVVTVEDAATGASRFVFKTGTTERLRIDSAGLATFANAVAFTGVISPTQLTGNTDNWDPTGLSTAAVIRMSSDAGRNLTGIVAQTGGRRITLLNIGAYTITLVHDATSTAANRFYCPGLGNLSLRGGGGVDIWYDATTARWRVIAP